jgi:ribulose-phosphate 3-epimerase
MTHASVAPILAPSILSADFARLDDEIRFAECAEGWLHCDIMDNHFVPNLTFGPLMVDAVRRLTDRPLDVHLMVTDPLSLVKPFRSAGADRITAHIEANGDAAATLAAIRASGARAGLALKPGTPLNQAIPLLDHLDLLLVMTVEPGFGGQAFLSDMLEKVREAARLRDARGLHFLIEVDGGIGPETARACRQAGADVFVAGHALFRAHDRSKALADLGFAVGLNLHA